MKKKFESIKIYSETKEELDSIKIIPRESYDSVINRAITTSSLLPEVKQ